MVVIQDPSSRVAGARTIWKLRVPKATVPALGTGAGKAVPHKHKDPTSKDFLNTLLPVPENQHVGSFCLSCGLLGPKGYSHPITRT